MTENNFDRLHFDGIQTLRGLAAILVVMEHIRFFACGAFGVDIFFCISGFMIMLTTQNDTGYFFKKRLIRIVPFYWIMTLGSFALMLLFPSMFQASEATLSRLVKSLLFIPFDMGSGVLQPLLRIGWTVNCEMFFYLLFWLAFHISHKYRGLLCSIFLLVCTGLGTILSGGCTLTGDNLLSARTPSFLAEIFSASAAVTAEGAATVSPWLAPIYFYGSPVMLEFGLGILCYYMVKKIYKKCAVFRQGSIPVGSQSNQKHSDSTAPRQWASRLTGIVLLLLGLSILVILACSAKQANILGYRRFIVWGIPAMAAVLCFSLGGLILPMPRPAVRLGDISFSIYMIHYYPIMFMDRKIFDFSTMRPFSLVGACLGLLLVILLAAAAWYLIEKKLTGWLRTHFLPVKS